MFRFFAHMVQIAKTAIKIAVCVVCVSGVFCGCGTTRWSDSSRTGTEQLLISNAIDRAVGEINFTPLSEKKVFLKSDAVTEATDNKYLVMALRQHVAASGAVLCDYREDADYIVEIRAGAIGTDRDDMLVGIPAFTMPSIPGLEYSAATIPEIPFIKRTRQRGVAKIAAFAYNRHTGRPLWASGNNEGDSTARNLWIAGTGPLTQGSIYTEATFAGDNLPDWVADNIDTKGDKHRGTFADRSILFPEKPGALPVSSPTVATTEASVSETASTTENVGEAHSNTAATMPTPPVPLLPTPSLPYPVYSRPVGSASNPVPVLPGTDTIFAHPIQ